MLAKISMEHAPAEVRDNLKAHASMMNVPTIGVDGNDCYSAVQINIQPAVNHGTGAYPVASLCTVSC